MAKVKSATSAEEVARYLHEVRDIIAEEVPWIPVYAYKLAFAVSPRVKGFVLAPENWQDLTGLELVE